MSVLSCRILEEKIARMQKKVDREMAAEAAKAAGSNHIHRVRSYDRPRRDRKVFRMPS